MLFSLHLHAFSLSFFCSLTVASKASKKKSGRSQYGTHKCLFLPSRHLATAEIQRGNFTMILPPSYGVCMQKHSHSYSWVTNKQAQWRRHLLLQVRNESRRVSACPYCRFDAACNEVSYEARNTLCKHLLSNHLCMPIIYAPHAQQQ